MVVQVGWTQGAHTHGVESEIPGTEDWADDRYAGFRRPQSVLRNLDEKLVTR